MNQLKQFLTDLQNASPSCKFVNWEDVTKIEIIGKGSYGRVYEVEVPNISNHLALKVIEIVENDPNDIKRIISEIQILQSSIHPNILPLCGVMFNEKKRKIGLLTPLKWGSLAKVIDNIFKGSPDQIPKEFNNEMKQKIIFGITVGLYYLSLKNIIHRDIKPQNILLDEDFNPFICDFGFAKERNHSFRGSHNIVGTLFFMDPDMFLNHKSNEKVDIYSWAIVVFCI